MATATKIMPDRPGYWAHKWAHCDENKLVIVRLDGFGELLGRGEDWEEWEEEKMSYFYDYDFIGMVNPTPFLPDDYPLTAPTRPPG